MTPGRLYRVLLADDVAALRRLVRIVLEGDGRFQVVGEAADGLEAQRMAGETQPDLVLLDLSMPRADGLEALPGIRRAAPRARVVLFSGFTADRMAIPGRALGADAYIEKGATPEELVRGLLLVMESESGPDGEVAAVA